jgi:Transglycosylase SLT domain
MAGGFDDFLSWLAGGTQLGNMLGIASPTASTQSPTIVPSGTAPTLGGAPPASGAPAGLLGGQAVNPMSYFQPRPGLLGDSPLGNMLTGAFSGLGSAAGTGGLTGLGNAFAGGSQAVQDKRKQMMATALAGQQYQTGQQGLITSNLTNQIALDRANFFRRHYGQPLLTMADLIANPSLASNPAGAATQPATGSQPQGQQSTPATAPATAPAVALPDIANAIHMQESGGATGGPPSDVGATGGWQIMPDTFKSYAHPGEDINNPKDNAAVAQRIIADLAMKGGNDPARIAVGYVSGPGNMAPPGSPTPWIKDFPVDPKNPNGLHVSGYVASIKQRLGLSGSSAAGQGQQAGGGQQATGGYSHQSIEDAIAAGQVPPGMAEAYDMAWQSQDFGKIADAEMKIGEYLAGPQHAAETTGLTQDTTYGGQQAEYDRAQKQADNYKANKTVQLYGTTKPAADAFQAAYASRGQPGGSSDYALVEAALQVLNPNVPVARPGTAEYATQLQTLPGNIAEQWQKAIGTNTALPQPAVDQLKQAVEQRMAINRKLLDKVNESFRQTATKYKLQATESDWNPEGYGSQSDQTGTSPVSNSQIKNQPDPKDHHINLATGKPWVRGETVTDNNGKVWSYSGTGDSADQKNWRSQP